MFTFLVILMALLAIGLCVIILLQAGKGGGLASTFGGASSSQESFMGGRQAATFLTKATWAGGGLFLVLGLVLSVMSAGTEEQSGSILRGEFQQGQGPGGASQAPTSVLESERTGAQSEQGGGGDASGGSGGGQAEGGGDGSGG